MSDITLSPQTVALVGTLLTSLVGAIGILSGAVVLLYRQVLRERDRLLEERDRVLSERDARLVDIWRDVDQKEIEITTLRASNDRLQQLALDATTGWRDAVAQGASRP